MNIERDFPVFARNVHARLQIMSKSELFMVDMEDIFTTYLLAFPEGTNPIFRKQTEHDCSCCKQFIRNFGRTVAIVDNKRMSVWGDGSDLKYPYNQVAAQLNAVIQQAPIKSIFRTKEDKYGAPTTVEMMGDTSHVWHHFHGIVAKKHHSPTPDKLCGDANTTAGVLQRGLVELRPVDVETVIELVEQGALYRGTEHLRALKEFQTLQREYAQAADKDLVIWANIDKPAARFRNTAIGTLIQDLSEGMGLERAVRSFESKVAPTNYKRPKALVTPKMIDQAMDTLIQLNLENSLDRRFANIEDVSVNDVLFVDNAVRGKMKGGLRDLLMKAAVQSPVNQKTTIPTTIAAFVEGILPEVTAMSLHLKNTHLGNFMSLTAPVHSKASPLFKWRNNFAWTYDGDVTDSIKERVKRAGGNTGAALRVSLAWSNYDDLDIHAHCPDGHVCYITRMGILDVDMNAGGGRTRTPVENLSWVKPRDGLYRIHVNQYSKRETKDTGFTLEVECQGQVQQFSCRHNPDSRESVDCLEFRISRGAIESLKTTSTLLKGGSIATEKWGLNTEQAIRVNSMMTSPNHWDGAGSVGSKHWIFVLDGCKNPDHARGLYNEFLRNDLEAHRKVFEILGGKTKCPPSEQQLSGVGFTAGRGDTVLVTTTTPKSTRTYEISF